MGVDEVWFNFPHQFDKPEEGSQIIDRSDRLHQLRYHSTRDSQVPDLFSKITVLANSDDRADCRRKTAEQVQEMNLSAS
jgi:hypothetical protein